MGAAIRQFFNWYCPIRIAKKEWSTVTKGAYITHFSQDMKGQTLSESIFITDFFQLIFIKMANYC
ncbi:hypothetical protein A9255_17080 [Xenorhabdus hominickii]|uniref:Uncharacterized protein n=1 Tax=Xenorhabdus hominickii TaxID=351679 RepID=A0ABN4SA36_XENHO|nr:hypothetical protein A9255_17080 [Xenorhabdus hominickii]